jgi:hypothetical protein
LLRIATGVFLENRHITEKAGFLFIKPLSCALGEAENGRAYKSTPTSRQKYVIQHKITVTQLTDYKRKMNTTAYAAMSFVEN